MVGLAEFDSVEDLQLVLTAMALRPCESPGLSELDHALQCAAELKITAPDDLSLQVAGLVHDVAHGRCHIRDHGKVGADAVRRLLGERVAALVQRHVAAKRYLVTMDDDYRLRLSKTSIETFDLQGGLMTAAELADFSIDPYKNDAIRIREADDAAKTPGRVVPGLDTWLEPIRKVAGEAFAVRQAMTKDLTE